MTRDIIIAVVGVLGVILFIGGGLIGDDRQRSLSSQSAWSRVSSVGVCLVAIALVARVVFGIKLLDPQSFFALISVVLLVGGIASVIFYYWLVSHMNLVHRENIDRMFRDLFVLGILGGFVSVVWDILRVVWPLIR